MTDFHDPVLLKESVDALITRRDGLYIDVTFGGGGHSRAILDLLGSSGKLYAFDQDKDAIDQRIDDHRLVLIRSNFRYVANFLRYYGVQTVDGILADLGVSSFQLNADYKGFSYQHSEILDMRMNQLGDTSAKQFLAKTSEAELIDVLSKYGEVRNAKTVSRAILTRRKSRPIQNTQDLLQCIEPFVIGNRSRYLAQLFQAIRIKVNDEMGALVALLKTSERVLRPGGRLIVITYHSVEDRIVKHFMKRGQIDGVQKATFSNRREDSPWSMRPLTKKPITPTDQEIKLNNRARSAKLRVAEKID